MVANRLGVERPPGKQSGPDFKRESPGLIRSKYGDLDRFASMSRRLLSSLRDVWP